MSNLPPGVSASDPMIVGALRDYSDDRTCGAEEAIVTSISPVSGLFLGRALEILTKPDAERGPLDKAAVIALLGQVRADAMDVEVAVCPFEGPVSVEQYGREEQWECPLCRHQHVSEVDGE